jgi:hypothetical protein
LTAGIKYKTGTTQVDRAGGKEALRIVAVYTAEAWIYPSATYAWAAVSVT